MVLGTQSLVTRRERVSRAFALCFLLLLSGLALAGPSGLLAWGENNSVLDQRKLQIATLAAERNELRNRVDLLSPAGADMDLAGELVRAKLNVFHPDEVVVLLDEPNR